MTQAHTSLVRACSIIATSIIAVVSDEDHLPLLTTFINSSSVGPEEDLPRKMEYLEFVCHAPSEYFKSKSSPFPTMPIRPEKGYIWTHIGPTPTVAVKETIGGGN